MDTLTRSTFNSRQTTSLRKKVGVGLFGLGFLASIGFGVVYLLKPSFMSYHAVAVGMDWEAVPPAFQVLVLALMRAAGGGMLAIGLVGLVLLAIPVRDGANWARWTALAMTWGLGAFLLYGTILVRLDTPASPPTSVPIAAFVTSLIAFFLCAERGKS